MEITKTKSKSFFVKVPKTSPLTDSFFCEKPTYKGRNVDVLKISIISDHLLLIELIFIAPYL